MIYLARKNGTVVAHADRQAMLDLDGVTPEMQATEAEFEAAGGLARIIGGEIFLGKTDEEKAGEERQGQIAGYMAELEELDRQAGAGRFIRETSIAYAQANGMDGGKGYESLAEIEARAGEIRETLAPLLAELQQSA
jgi:hypothetical protein